MSHSRLIIMIAALLNLNSCHNHSRNKNMTQHFKFNTQYNQFYIADSASSTKIDLNNFWSPEAYEDRLAAADGILGVGTECYGPVKGEIEILDNANDTFMEKNFDHIVEGGIAIKSDKLEIQDCPTSTVRLKIQIEPGVYRVRIYSSNLRSVVGGEAGDDYYRIEIWPDSSTERKVLKHYTSK